MEYLLIKYRDNWADEIDVEGFVVVKKSDWEALLNKMQAFFSARISWEFGIGTNEEIYYSTFKEWEKTLKYTELSEVEFIIISKVFNAVGNGKSYITPEILLEHGFFPWPCEEEFDGEF